MQKNKFLRSTFILLIGSFITKTLGFFIKIMYTRIIGPEGISLYTLIVPLFSLTVTIAGFGMPFAISKIVAENKIRSKQVILHGVIILLLLNVSLMIAIILGSDFIATYLLHEPKVKILIIGSVMALPNVGLACLLKGYFYGKQKMLPNTISNIIEQTIRILFIIFILPLIVKKSLIIGILSYLLLNVVTELASIITFIFLLPKNVNLKINEFKYDKNTINTLLNTSIPLVSSKIIGNIGYFFEPIILSNTMLFVGYSASYFTQEYGIYNAYSIALLLMPSFLIQAICTATIPEISRLNSTNKTLLKKRIKQIISISLLIGIISTSFITIFRDKLLLLIYNTTLGSDYIKYLSYFFFLYYLEAPISAILQALGYGQNTLKISTIGVIIKLLAMFIFTLLKIGLYGLIIAEFLNIIYIVSSYVHELLRIKKNNSTQKHQLAD